MFLESLRKRRIFSITDEERKRIASLYLVTERGRCISFQVTETRKWWFSKKELHGIVHNIFLFTTGHVCFRSLDSAVVYYGNPWCTLRDSFFNKNGDYLRDVDWELTAYASKVFSEIMKKQWTMHENRTDEKQREWRARRAEQLAKGNKP